MSGNPGSLVHGDAVINCPHGGRVVAGAARTEVYLDGMPLATAADTMTITGCPHTADGVARPCATLRWDHAGTPAGAGDAGGVLLDGVPVPLDTTAAQCLDAAHRPQGPPRIIAAPSGVIFR